jgi:hypothetical protein
MPASQHVSPKQFMYHESHLSNRESIQSRGLQAQVPYNASDLPAGVYLSPHNQSEYGSSMNDAPHFGYDRWRVDVTGLDLQVDKSQPTSTRFSPEHIPAERIKLAKKGHPNWKKHI